MAAVKRWLGSMLCKKDCSFVSHDDFPLIIPIIIFEIHNRISFDVHFCSHLEIQEIFLFIIGSKRLGPFSWRVINIRSKTSQTSWSTCLPFFLFTMTIWHWYCWWCSGVYWRLGHFLLSLHLLELGYCWHCALLALWVSSFFHTVLSPFRSFQAFSSYLFIAMHLASFLVCNGVPSLAGCAH